MCCVPNPHAALLLPQWTTANGCRGCTARITFAAQCNVVQTPPPTPVSQPPFCVSGANCYNGPDRGLWFSSAEAWSLGAFPSFPQQVRTQKRIVLSERARGTSRNILIHDANVELAPGLIEIGPTSCDASENLVQDATANTNAYEARWCAITPPQSTRRRLILQTSRVRAQSLLSAGVRNGRILRPLRRQTATVPTTPLAGDEYEAKVAGTHHDRVCASHTKCAAAHWITRRLRQQTACAKLTAFARRHNLRPRAREHHDRECQAHRVCTNSEFETKDAGTP